MSDLEGLPITPETDWCELFRSLAGTAPLPPVGAEPPCRRILIPMLVGGSDLFSMREGLIAHALRLRGSRVLFVLCDGLEACNERSVLEDPPDVCRRCHRRGLEHLRAFGHSVASLSDHVDPDDAEALRERARTCAPEDLLSFEYAGVRLGPYVYASTLRYFYAGAFDIRRPEVLAKAREYLAAALVMTEAVRNLYRAFRPDKVFSSHGVYTSWGPWAAVARAMRIPHDRYNGGWRRNTLLVNRAETPPAACNDIWPEHEHTPLTPSQERCLDRYLASRESNAEDFYQFFEAVDPDLEGWYRERGISPGRYRQRVTLFTNIVWDAAAMGRPGAFATLGDWLVATVKQFLDRPDVLLLIKVHPGETRWLTRTPGRWQVPSILREELGELPESIRLIEADDPVSNFALYRDIDYGLVFSSSVGLEAALAGVPVLCGSDVHYARPKIVAIPDGERAYRERLLRWIEQGPDFTPDRAVARRYAYTLFFRKLIPFEPIDVEGWGIRRVRCRSLEDLVPGPFPGLDALCRGIQGRAPLAYEEPLDG